MKSPFSLFLALRFLKPKRTFVSVITLISVLGVTLGVTVLILVIAVMHGFDQELRRKVLGFDAHLNVTASNDLLRDWRNVDAELLKTSGVTATAPFVQGPVLADFQGKRLTPQMRGIDINRELAVTDIRSTIVAGSLDLDGDKVVLGEELAAQLGIRVGDKLTVISPKSVDEIMNELEKVKRDPSNRKTLEELQEMVLPAELTVTGIFKTGRFFYDSAILLVPLHVGQELYGTEDNVTGLSVRTIEPYQAPSVQQALYAKLPGPLKVDTWIDLNKELFDAIAMERNVMFFLLLFIVIVAAFGIMNTLITVTVQKTREIGIMKALGATTSQIVWIFLLQGMVVGFFGNVAGLTAGLTLVHWRNEFKDWLASTLGIKIFPPGIYQFAEIPAEVDLNNILIICITGFVICSVAALIPAYSAARLDPVKALRHE